MKSQRTQARQRHTRSGLALIVTVLVFGLLASSAVASETAPENTSAPTISPGWPYVEWAAQGKTGTWSGEPTSYAYAWERCGPECVPISGATGSSYTPSAADAGKSLRLAVTATNAYGSTTAYSGKSGAVQQSLNWYESIGASWQHLGTSSPFTSTLTAYGMTVNYPYVGANVEISCSGLNGTGTLTNQETTAGIDGFDLEPKWCGVIAPAGKGCYLDGYTIDFHTLKAVQSSPGSLKPEFTVAPTSGNTVAEFTMKGCQGSEVLQAFNKNYWFTGWFPAQFDASAQTLGWTISSIKASKGLRLNGSNVSGMTAYNTLKSEAGNLVKLDSKP